MSYEEDRKKYFTELGTSNVPMAIRNYSSSDINNRPELLCFIADYVEELQARLKTQVNRPIMRRDIKPYYDETFQQWWYPVAEDMATIMAILGKVVLKIRHADHKHADDPMELDDMPAALGVIECEFTELKREVNRLKPRPDLMKQEAIDLAAAVIKFLRDICK